MKQGTVTNILRYWLQCIRHEEALSARPKAWRSEAMLPGMVTVNMKDPTLGRAYFKLSLGDVAALLETPETPVVRPFDAEIAEFFESWLAGRYRMPDRVNEGPAIMVTAPTMQLRFGDLAGLFRFNAVLRFGYEGGEDFVVPTRRERRKGGFPPPPTEVRIERSVPEEGLPFFIDGRLLSRELAVSREEVDALFETLSKFRVESASMAECLAALTSYFDGDDAASGIGGCLERLTLEMSRRLTASAHAERCYPVGIVMDAGRVKPTWHLQRELLRLIEDGVTESKRPVLYSYLTRASVPQNRTPVMGVLNAEGLTPSQSDAAERFLGSALTVVEGPPGTGKTTMVLHLAAHLLVSRVAAFVENGRMPVDLTVVASTNNRAVDNVIDGLSQVTGTGTLPLAVRVGSRRVCQEVFAARLRDIERWFKQMLAEGGTEAAKARLDRAVSEFVETSNTLNILTEPERKRKKALDRKQKLEGELRRLDETLGGVTEAVDVHDLAQAKRVLTRLEKRLERLSELAGGRPSKKRRTRVRNHFETMIALLSENVGKTLSPLGIEGPVFEAPDERDLTHRKALEAWEDAAENGLNRVLDILRTLDERQRFGKVRLRRKEVEQRLAELEVPEAVAMNRLELDRLKYELFERAVRVREAYAILHADTFLEAIAAARRVAEEQASLRYFSRRDAFEQLAALFPLWGTTLLSMGNVFDDREGVIRQVIIDESGQCHPAYAVSALMRCSKAMVLGDVHQLSPIFGLTAEDERPIFRDCFGDRTADLSDFRVFDRAETSVQYLAEKGAEETVRLMDHFRCQREIISISNRLCGYRLTVHTPKRSRQDLAPFLDRPVRFVPIAGAQERLGGSWWNRAEAERLIEWLKGILDAGIPEDDIAVITPYRGQLYQLRRTIAGLGISIEASAELLDDAGPHSLLRPSGLAIGTVHRFQGGERSIVLFSTVVTETGSLGFINQRVNLINVAVSRAREHLVVFGHGPTLEMGRMSRLLLSD